MSETISDQILKIENELTDKLRKISFSSPVVYVYNPLEYAKDCHVNFIRRYYDQSNGEILFLGMNPGPWGMCQNGIPFGEKSTVKDWFTAEGNIERPEKEHAKVKIEGLECKKSEVSGKRFWGLMRNICKTPENFFRNCLLYNYCPLAFLSESGTNVTPTEIKGDKSELYAVCDEALAEIIKRVGIKTVIGLGRFAVDRVQKVLKQINRNDVRVFYMPHPSPRAGTEESWNTKAVEVLRISGVYDKLKAQDDRNE